jgi:hypothetical protein
MQEQQQAGKARILGYALGLAAFIVIATWKFIVR